MNHIQVWEPFQGDVEGVRQTFRQRMAKRYEGWSDEYDEQWDKNSFLFVLKNGNEYEATCRMIVKRYHDICFTTPMEKANVQAYSLDQYHNICLEGGMVSFNDIQSFGILMYHVTNWLFENEVDYLFTCYDVDNQFIKSLYVDMLNFEVIKDAHLIYGGFSSKKTNEEVKWQVVGADKERGKHTLDKFLADLGLIYEKGVHPTLKDWAEGLKRST